MEDFKQYYKFPLKPMEGLELVKVLTDDNKMAFDWCWKNSRDVYEKIINIINGNNTFRNTFNDVFTVFYYDKRDCCVYFHNVISNPTPILRIRGWGMLTDHPYHLSEEEAKRIQDEFGEFIRNQLSS